MSDRLFHFTDKERQQALDRYNIIKPYLENHVTLKELSRTKKSSYSTLSRWVKNYRSNGITGLIDKKRKDSGKTRVINNDFRLFVEGMALQIPKLSMATIHRKTVEIAKQKNWKIPSYGAVRKIIKSIPPAMLTLAHEGSKTYEDEFDLLYPRKSDHPNEIWQADHTLLDIWLLNDKNKPQRPWLTIIMDDYSRAVAGYFLTFQSPNTQNTSLALHQAIWYKKDSKWNICGIPEIFYTDHGSDFTSLHLEQVSHDIKMNLSFSLVGKPRGRGIVERFFLTINQLFLCELPGYSEDGKKLKELPVMKIDEFEVLLKEFLINKHNFSTHSETKEIPQKRWMEGAFIPRLPESKEELDLLLLTECKPRKVHQDGIHFHNIKYIEPTLAAYVGEQVVIRYDPRDIVEIRIFHEGKFICRAISYELAGHNNISLKDIIKARNKRKNELKKEISDRKDIVEAYLEHYYEKDIESIKENERKNPPKRKLKRYMYE